MEDFISVLFLDFSSELVPISFEKLIFFADLNELNNMSSTITLDNDEIMKRKKKYKDNINMGKAYGRFIIHVRKNYE